ncbi:Predicted transcriptional regulator, contains HTH domain [Sphingomonas sp. YR710]|uniref:ATP-binding protein n=1 Tax=Sphingomonas sp. YR710 TaxID=1882773 RepID=UPI000890620A|nr:ATP-binding protein [Sphingomonas sp. YR710]SDD10694.1 Predicted transcriptional regulator, contains HTH domain [Sphingomonas sp. YR710]
MTDLRTIALIDDLRDRPAETSWIEFKENNFDPDMIGVRVSALANAARLANEHFAYIVWGIRDADHAVVGAHFRPSAEKAKGQPLEFYLAQRLQPSVPFSFREIDHPDGRVVLLEIPAATTAPVEYERTAYIRIGSATPRLSDHPERQKALWAKLQPYAWEDGIAAQFVTGDDVLSMLDYTSYFELTEQPLPDNRAGIFDRLAADRLIAGDVGGRWNITNLGAILTAKKLDAFAPSIARKAVRFVSYNGQNRAASVTNRRDGQRGYASGFRGLIEFINGVLPKNEHIGSALRSEHPLFPEIAIRELIANALIHQDMTISGAGPLIELFTDRLEITNPGIPLINPDRFIDSPPRSRNEALAALMRRMRICEEQGTGIDKVIASVEFFQLPPPDFRAEDNATRVTLFSPRKFSEMTGEERVRACYQHAVLRYVSGDRMKNSTLRERFGVESQNAAQISGVIRQALDRNIIRYADIKHPKVGYLPFWA